MELPAFSPNLIVFAVLIITTVYGLFGGKQRVRLLILSVYVGVVLAEQMASLVSPYLKMLAPEQVSLLLFGAPVLIFGLARGGSHDKGSAVANGLIGLFTGGLIVSSALRLLPTSQMAAIDNGSFIATELQLYHLWLLGLLPVAALLFSLFKAKDKRKHH